MQKVKSNLNNCKFEFAMKLLDLTAKSGKSTYFIEDGVIYYDAEAEEEKITKLYSQYLDNL